MKPLNPITGSVPFEVTFETVFFFDLDGTLVETNRANFLSYQTAINLVTKSDFNPTYSETLRFNRSVLKTIVPGLSEVDYDNIIKVKEECYKEFLQETELNLHVADILCKYSKSNNTVLVTNSRMKRALDTLNYYGLTDKFNNLFFRPNYPSQRVNKYQRGITTLGIKPKTVVAFENEDIEISDAKKAGIEIINPNII